MIRHFNKRIILCNQLCITHPQIKRILYEEEDCLNTCQRKILEVEAVVKKHMNNNFEKYLDPNSLE